MGALIIIAILFVITLKWTIGNMAGLIEEIVNQINNKN